MNGGGGVVVMELYTCAAVSAAGAGAAYAFLADVAAGRVGEPGGSG